MKSRREDEIIQMAFGEPGVNVHQESLTTEEAKQVALMAQLKQDLKSLSVPEHQLSTERLRHAILSEGLERPKAPFAWTKWLVAPIATGIAAFAITTMWNMAQTPSEVSIVTSPTAVSTSSGSEAVLEPSLGHWANPDLNQMMERAQAAPVTADSAVAAPSVRIPVERKVASRSTRNPRVTATQPETERLSEVTEMATAGIRSAYDSVEPNALRSTGISEEAAPAATTIVVIEPTKDSQTGANRAVEVTSSNDVLIGG